MATAGGFLAAAVRRYVERRRASAVTREEVLEKALLAADGAWSWRMECRRRWQVLRELCNDVQECPCFNKLFLSLIYINTVLMAVEHHGMSKQLTDGLTIANLVGAG